MERQKRRYLVLKRNGSVIVGEWSTLPDAQADARRLAEGNPDDHYIIAETIGHMEKSDVRWVPYEREY